ncbi:hypothetical protein PsorP6_016203 [Peronosclerospora sorghi]|uniref:Uncharacterized protein n=1 Tax=Peronosclerospora sorghi TaxID=230839 RepID=A0ACC0VLJ4_9STRA|nr:hypothetical protein PsorP6_016203 [Peronosclerospora sorghi]
MKYQENGLPKNWDGKDWDTYKRAMTNFFAEQDLLDTKESDTKKENKVHMYIDMSVPPSVAAQLRESNTGSDMWETLCEVYETKKDTVLRAHKIRRLRSELENMSFLLGGDMNLHLAQMFNKKRELEQLGFKVHDIEMIDLMLKSLPHHSFFLSFKSVLKFCSDQDNLDPTNVRHRMLLAAQEVAEIQAQDGRGQATGGKGKAKGDEKGAKDSGNSGEASARRCFKCKSTGHIKANCPKIKKPSAGEGSGGAITKETNVFRSGGQQSTHASGSGVARVTDGGRMNGQVNHQKPLGSTEHLWYFDSGADAHVTGNRDYFVTFEIEIDGGVDLDEDDDDEQDEDASMNYGVDLNDHTVGNDDRAVGAGAQDTGTGVETNTDDGANNDSASSVNGSVDRDYHASEPSHDSPSTAEEGDQVSTEE